MEKIMITQTPEQKTWEDKRHPKCKGSYDAYTGEYECGYDTSLICEDCKYGIGREDPEAKCNQA
jgi:hypothetical protein